jgi:hypothetical protein
MNAGYERAKKAIMAALGEIPKVNADPSDYLAALAEIGSEVEDWFAVSVDAARDDVARAKRED